MATTKTDMLANIARSMQGRPDVSPGNRPDVSPGNPSSLSRRSQGYRRLESAAVIALDRIIPDPNQPRTEFDPESMERLAASLRERGQLQPIRVRWDDAADRYVVVVGERRWRAAGAPVWSRSPAWSSRESRPPRTSWRTSSWRTRSATT